VTSLPVKHVMWTRASAIDPVPLETGRAIPQDDRGRWTQVNLLHYDQPQAKDVEGMGFGAFNHFWMAGRDALYEVGGDDLSRYTDPTHH